MKKNKQKITETEYVVRKKAHHYFIPHEYNNFKPHAIRHKSLVFYSLFLITIKIVTILSVFLSCPTGAEFSTITSRRIVELTNQERVLEGLSVLSINETLNESARLKMEDMLDYGYFAHNSPQGIRPWHWFREVDYDYTFAGENLAMNFIEAEDTLQAWIGSPSHRENILSKDYQEIGVAVGIGKIDGEETTVVVQHFGKRYLVARVEGEQDFRPEDSEIITEREIGQVVAPTENNILVSQEGIKHQIELSPKKSDFFTKFIKYSDILFIVFLIFMIVNLLLTMFIRLEIQHKSIILHSVLVIALILTLVLWKTSFIENIGRVIIG
jgi:hypothetical protein